jgi:hypothetical protein
MPDMDGQWHVPDIVDPLPKTFEIHSGMKTRNKFFLAHARRGWSMACADM